MKVVHRSVSFLLVGMLAFPAWAASDIVGSIISSQAVTLRDTSLTAGSTIFSGDSIVASEKGGAKIALIGGDQVELLDKSSMQLKREKSAIAMTIEHGSVYFWTLPGSTFTAVLEDAVIRPTNGSAVGLIHLDSPDSAVVVAQHGGLTIRTQHDGNSVTVSEGSAARINLVASQNNGGQTPQPAGRSTPGGNWSRRKIALIVLIAGGGALAGGLIAASHEHKLTAKELQDLISPTKL